MVVCCPTLVLETKLRTSAKTINNISHGVISQAPPSKIIYCYITYVRNQHFHRDNRCCLCLCNIFSGILGGFRFLSDILSFKYIYLLINLFISHTSCVSSPFSLPSPSSPPFLHFCLGKGTSSMCINKTQHIKWQD